MLRVHRSEFAAQSLHPEAQRSAIEAQDSNFAAQGSAVGANRSDAGVRILDVEAIGLQAEFPATNHTQTSQHHLGLIFYHP